MSSRGSLPTGRIDCFGIGDAIVAKSVTSAQVAFQCYEFGPTRWTNSGVSGDCDVSRPTDVFDSLGEGLVMTSPTSVVSMFSGCGGLDLGFKSNDFELIYACDNDQAAVECYARNVDSRVARRDVTSSEFHKELASLGGCDVLLGGFPCQGFSKAGPKRRDDSRNALYVEMLRAVRVLQPRIFIGENVDGMVQNYDGAFLRKIHNDFSSIGYRLEYRILDAAAFGVAQHRRRIFIVGVRYDVGDFRWPVATHVARQRNGEFRVTTTPTLFDGADLAPLAPTATIADAVGDLLALNNQQPDHAVTWKWPSAYAGVFAKIGEGQKLCNVRHAQTSVYTWDIPEVFGSISGRQRQILETISRNRRHKRYGTIPNGNPLPAAEVSRLASVPEIAPDLQALVDKGYLKNVGGKFDLKGAMFCSGIFKRPNWDEPAPTVLTNFHNPRYFLHPKADRPFSLRECARLQGFPDSFVFQGPGVSLVDGYRLVGNAVPPPVAGALAVAVREALGASRTQIALAL